ncbi:hypothetical protein [Nocardioides coralli]|uniref:hypothetical protein n=1 Tax=Nocardioides coralli TaxID=2872154 RepID=UPI001CA4448C|nr:hypothetical protein [Nocardioides coralli]QZY30612.1 hypothetical protein K6T13_08220 [Nocardioides coralli]
MLLKILSAAHVPLDELPSRSGAEVATELAGRALLRYVAATGVHENSHPGPTFVTPTAYTSSELNSYLALPRPDLLRDHAIWIDPSRVDTILGPRWVHLGSGIEYVLPNGYTSDAVIEPGWAVQIR